MDRKDKQKNSSINISSGSFEDSYNENNIDDILENITLIKPKKPFTQFCCSEYARLQKEGTKIKIKNIMKDLGERWSKLKEDEKRKYNEMYEKEKKEYIKSIEIVRHFIFKDYNGIIRRPATPYQIFLNQKLIEGLDKNLEPKNIKKAASNEWKEMKKEDKKPYYDKKKENDNWFQKAKNIKKVCPVSIFIQKQFSLAKEKKEQLPNIGELSNKWKSLKASEKNKYVNYAKLINEEREKLQDIYELINGVKPKRPAGAFRIFIQEKAKDNIFNSIKDGKDLWARLTDEEKDDYLKKSHKLVLAYRYKKMIYQKKIKKILPKKPPNALFIFIKDKKGQKIPNNQKTISYWKPIFDKLPKNEKNKYEEKAKIEKEIYEKKMDRFKNAIFDIPKKPLSPYIQFVRDLIPKLKEKKEYQNLPYSELYKNAAIIWQNSSPELKKKLEENFEDDKKRFKNEMKQFEKFGYYTKREDDELIDKRKITKKRSKIIKTNKGNKKTKSVKKIMNKVEFFNKKGKTQINKK